MRASSKLLLLLIGMCLVGTAPAVCQDRYSDVPPGTSPTAAAPTVNGPAIGAVTVFADRASFQAAFPGLTFEDFSDTNAPPDFIETCDSPISSSSNDACFSPGAIPAGLEIAAIPGGPDSMVTLTPAALDVPCVAVGPNAFAVDSEISFGMPTTAFGVDILCALSPNDLSVELFGASGSLGTSTVGCGGTPQFWGISSSEPINRIEFTNPGGEAGELFCNVEFGAPDVPLLPSWALSGLVLLLLAAGLLALGRRSIAV